MKTRNQKLIGLNAIPSLILALLVSIFFASGGFAENYTNSYFVAPFFFIILLVWLIGLILGLVTRHVLLSVPLMYLSIVIGFVISSLIYN